jgi:hypothetical protein
MPRQVKRRKYKPTKFGEGMQPGTVDWELARRQVRKQRKLEDVPTGFLRLSDAVMRFFWASEFTPLPAHLPAGSMAVENCRA